MPSRTTQNLLVVVAFASHALCGIVHGQSHPIQINSGNLTLIVQPHNFRYGFQVNGQ